MAEPLLIVLVPRLLTWARLYGEQLPALWRLGPVATADPTRDHTMAAIARRILAATPPRFALVGLSMGGSVAFEILRQRPGRVAGLALLDTSARPDAPDQTHRRDAQIALAQGGFLLISDWLAVHVLAPLGIGGASVVGQIVIACAGPADQSHDREQRPLAAAAVVRQRPARVGGPEPQRELGFHNCHLPWRFRLTRHSWNW